jgi:hypothetical protein
MLLLVCFVSFGCGDRRQCRLSLFPAVQTLENSSPSLSSDVLMNLQPGQCNPLVVGARFQRD